MIRLSLSAAVGVATDLSALLSSAARGNGAMAKAVTGIGFAMAMISGCIEPLMTTVRTSVGAKDTLLGSDALRTACSVSTRAIATGGSTGTAAGRRPVCRAEASINTPLRKTAEASITVVRRGAACTAE